MALNRKNATKTSTARVLPPIPDGPTDARVVQVVGLGLQERPPWKGQKKAPCDQLLVVFELLDHYMPKEDDYEVGDDFTNDEETPRVVSQILKMYPPNPRRQSATQEEEFYAALDPKNEHDGDWTKLVGAPCTAMITNRESDGKTYVNVNSVAPSHPRLPYRDPVLPLVVFDTESFDEEVYEELWPWVQAIIDKRITDPGAPMTFKDSRVETPEGEDGGVAMAAGEVPTDGTEKPAEEQEELPW